MKPEQMVTCGNCGREWNSAALPACPGCKSPAYVTAPPAAAQPSAPAQQGYRPVQVDNQAALLAEQNRLLSAILRQTEATARAANGTRWAATSIALMLVVSFVATYVVFQNL